MSSTADTLSALNRHRLSQVAEIVRRWHGTLRYVDYRQAESDVEILASRLLAHLPSAKIAGARFSAIPRGGLIVLGMLAYALDLKPWQLSPDAGDPEALHILIDDCALTGARFQEHLACLRATEVVFAHLYSNPRLREAIVQVEPRVLACLAAHDLQDHAHELIPDAKERELWRARWEERLQTKPYWLGQPEIVTFAWTEPDFSFWNPVSGHIDDGWRFLPPHLCLKNRFRAAGPEIGARPAWRTPPGIVTGDFDDTVWIVDLRTDRVFSLTHAGADLWRWWTALGDPVTVAKHLAADYQLSAEEAFAEAVAFAARLLDQELLESVEPVEPGDQAEPAVEDRP